MADSRAQFRICFLSSKHPPFDKRVFDKEAVTLAAADFDVVHLAPAMSSSERRAGVEVRTYPPRAGLVGRVGQLRDLYLRAVQVDADCYHCNEMDSWLIGILLRWFRRKRIVFDVHEDYPSNLGIYHFPRWLRPLVGLGVKLWIRVQLPFTDWVVLAKQSVAADYGSARNVLLVQNFTRLRPCLAPRKEYDNGGRIWALHLGLISRVRGWPQMLDALARTERDVGLWVIGTFNDDSRPQFEKRARELGLSERIKVEEWLPFDQVMERLAAAHIGLVLFQPGIRNHVMASPHKIFDYMQAGLAVIAPDFAIEVAEVIRSSGCGVLVNPADPVEIAAALDRLAERTSERVRMGEAGWRAVERRYNWESEGAKLVELYREMSECSRQPVG